MGRLAPKVANIEDGSQRTYLPRWYIKAIWYVLFVVTLSTATCCLALQLTDHVLCESRLVAIT